MLSEVLPTNSLLHSQYSGSEGKEGEKEEGENLWVFELEMSFEISAQQEQQQQQRWKEEGGKVSGLEILLYSK